MESIANLLETYDIAKYIAIGLMIILVLVALSVAKKVIKFILLGIVVVCVMGYMGYNFTNLGSLNSNIKFGEESREQAVEDKETSEKLIESGKGLVKSLFSQDDTEEQENIENEQIVENESLDEELSEIETDTIESIENETTTEENEVETTESYNWQELTGSKSMNLDAITLLKEAQVEVTDTALKITYKGVEYIIDGLKEDTTVSVETGENTAIFTMNCGEYSKQIEVPKYLKGAITSYIKNKGINVVE